MIEVLDTSVCSPSRNMNEERAVKVGSERWGGKDDYLVCWAGEGRNTMPTIMATGKVDIFAFIGTSKAADALIKVTHGTAHP